ncbi:MAG: signal peptidase II [Pelagibacteraceae bacterium TMED267]|nr:MAG: signal peptidase II [Pelagibacteraceae bacterium TMED267]|tara:strand:+ start:4705 stop:5202 length:498 start_codon:yes stop_codon:yes gene_type:complete
MPNLKFIKKNLFFNLIFVIIVFSLDRISKIYVIEKFKNNFDNTLYESKFLNIHLIWNEGIAFGLMSFDEKSFYNTLTIIIILVSLLILYLSYINKGLQRYALLSIFAGSLGNIYDRLFYNAVPDFIDFHVKDFHWFIFNIADIFITFGVIIMIMTEFLINNEEKK